MDEISYLDECRRTLRRWNQRKPVSRVCLVARIKSEFQSSVMALSNKTVLWDPTGRIYILMRVDKVLSMFYARLASLGKASKDSAITGIILVYPSMLFSALEISSDCVLDLNETLSQTVGGEESYVEPPTLINEAHGVERMYDRLLSVVLKIPGPMKMDLDGMRKMWQTSFKNVMRKVYQMGRAVSNHQLDRKGTVNVVQLHKSNGDMLHTTEPTPSRASNTGQSTSRQIDNDQEEESEHDSDDDIIHPGHRGSHQTVMSVLAPSMSRRTTRASRRTTISHRLVQDKALIDQAIHKLAANANLNASSSQMKPSNDSNNNIAEQSRPGSSQTVETEASSADATAAMARRTVLRIGDPALAFIPPQRDLVLILNCDKFRLLSDSVRLHTKKVNCSAEDNLGWPLEPVDVKMPLGIFGKDDGVTPPRDE